MHHKMHTSYCTVLPIWSDANDESELHKKACETTALLDALKWDLEDKEDLLEAEKSRHLNISYKYCPALD